MKTVLRVSNLTKEYHKNRVLDQLSFTMKEGDILGLVGGNGAGKTTLLRLIAGINRQDSGEIVILHPEKTCGKAMGVLIEQPAIYKDLSALDNLRYYGKMLDIEEKTQYEELLELVGLQMDKNKKAGRFSMGMKQRLGIAIALLGDVKLLILDEPFNGLDAEGVEDLKALLLQLQKKSVTILITSHMIGELTQVCSRYMILEKGKVLYEATHKELEAAAQGSGNIESFILKKLEESDR